MERSNHAKSRLDTANHISKFGWECLYVFPSVEGEAFFSYSIGFEETFGGPEIILFGVERMKAHSLLSACAELLRKGEVIEPDVPDDRILSGGYRVMFKHVKPEAYSEYFGSALRYYGEKHFRAVVMFLPDAGHKYPWETGYSYINASEALAIV